MHHLEQGKGRKGHSGDSRFLHQQVPGILQEKLAERGVMLYNETCAEEFYIFRYIKESLCTKF